jgi:acyl-CoA thioester hydrolase
VTHASDNFRSFFNAGVGLPVIEAHCEYKSPARYDDELVVQTTGKLLSPARVEFAYEISRPSDATVNAIGRTVHAAVDTTGRPCRLPDYIRDLFE